MAGLNPGGAQRRAHGRPRKGSSLTEISEDVVACRAPF